MRAHARDGAVAEPAAVRRARRAGRARRRRVRERRLPDAAAADRRRGGRGHGDRPRRGPVAARALGVAAARSRAPGWRRSSPVASPRCATSPTSSTRYALHRPELVRAWAAGEHGRLAGRSSGGGSTPRSPSPARPSGSRPRARGCAASRTIADLPPRFALFGLTRLPAGRLAVLRALAEHRDVHLFLLHPSPELWERCRGTGPVTQAGRRPDDARCPPTRCSPRGATTRGSSSSSSHGDAAEHHHAVEHGGDTLLARIQADVRDDREPPRADDPSRPPLDPADRSLQVHSCHGRARQVEVLHDAILHLLADDPTLEPRDVIVMCPDIETFAPLIQATFGAGEDERPGAPDLRVRLADRSSARPTRCSASWRGCSSWPTSGSPPRRCSTSPTASRCGAASASTTTTLARAEEWVRESGIRWGLDAGHRAPFKLDGLPSGTWRAGLDRLLLGVTMTEDEQRLFGGVLPLDDVESGAIELAGRVAELLDRLHAAVDALAQPKPVAEWAEAIGAAADALTTTSPRDAWQRAELQRLLDDVVTEAAGHGHRARPAGGPRAARRPPQGPPDAHELPHRPPDRLHARADALGAAPRRLPARARRRRVPAQVAARRRRPDARRTRTSASATPAPRTASSCSTR